MPADSGLDNDPDRLFHMVDLLDDLRRRCGEHRVLFRCCYHAVLLLLLNNSIMALNILNDMEKWPPKMRRNSSRKKIEK